MHLLLTKTAVNIHPSVLIDLGNFLEYAENAKISAEISSYRPLRRPIISPIEADNPAKRHLRKLLARDWFYFAIWAARLKRIFKKAPEILASRDQRLAEFKKNQLRLANIAFGRRPEKTRAAGDRLETEHSADSDDAAAAREREVYLEKMKRKIQEELQRNEEEKVKKRMTFWGVTLTMRCQEWSVKVFNESKDPSVEFQLPVQFFHGWRGGEQQKITFGRVRLVNSS